MSFTPQNLQTLLDEISHKFESSFANQQTHNDSPVQVCVKSDWEINRLLETQPQTPLKQQIHHPLDQNETQLELLEFKGEVNEEQVDNYNQESNNQSANECQLELTYSPQKIDTNLQNQAQGHHLVEYPQKYDRILNVQTQTAELQDQLITYQSLTQKFEDALSRLKHRQIISHNLSEFAARQQQYKKRKTTELNLLKQERQKQVSKLCPAKPLINSRSQQLLINHKPIQNRYQTIIEEKKKKIERQVVQKMTKKIEQEQQQLSEIRQHQEEIRKRRGSTLRSEADYFNQMKSWTQKRDKKIEDLAHKKQEQTKHQVTFKPSINPKSEIIMKKNTKRVPIYDKAPTPKTNLLVDSNCTFKPNLAKKTLKK